MHRGMAALSFPTTRRILSARRDYEITSVQEAPSEEPALPTLGTSQEASEMVFGAEGA